MSKQLEEIKERGSTGSGVTIDDIDWLIRRIDRFHYDVSLIRRASDDIPQLKDINRMAREALAEEDEG